MTFFHKYYCFHLNITLKGFGFLLSLLFLFEFYNIRKAFQQQYYFISSLFLCKYLVQSTTSFLNTFLANFSFFSSLCFYLIYFSVLSITFFYYQFLVELQLLSSFLHYTFLSYVSFQVLGFFFKMIKVLFAGNLNQIYKCFFGDYSKS